MEKVNGLNGNALLSFMAYRGMRQKDLAEVVGMSKVTINRVIQGKASPTLETIQKISVALDLTEDQFVEVFYNKKTPTTVSR